MPSKAKDQFDALVGSVDQLIAIHGKLQKGKGRRHQQDAIHRAGVVMMVAAWESYVEKVLMEALGLMETAMVAVGGAPGSAVPAWARHAFALRKAEIARLVRRFSTPDAEGVRDLMEGSLEFGPGRHWNWKSRQRQWDEKEMRVRLNAWVLVRHSVAHGFPLPPGVAWLQDPKGRPRLTLSLLKECKKFFEHLVDQTDAAFAVHLSTHHGMPRPW